MEFLEVPAFTRFLREYLSDEEYRSLQHVLALNPELGDVMAGTGGFRKLRWADPRRGKGRRGGLRVIYYYFSTEQQIWLMAVYGKDEADDLTPKEKKALHTAIAAELKQREEKRSRKIRR
jgi:mRNA-degrading endonuclease RelE of RelBE toxin-antitoxin system